MSYRILLVHNRYQIPGGEDTVFENEARLLEENGHTVFRYERNNSELHSMNKAEKLRVPFDTIYSAKTEREVRKLIREQKIDIVHVHNTLLLISSSVCDAARKEHVPVVQTIHNFRLVCPNGLCYRDGKICEDCLKLGLQCAVKHRCYRSSRAETLVIVLSLLAQRMRNIYRRMHFIALTEFNRRMLVREGQIALRQIDIKPNFTEETHACIPYEERKPQILFAGQLEESKGIRFLLEVARRMKDSGLLFVIYGTGSLEEECRRKIEEENLVHVKLMGQADHEVIMEEMAHSLALILPTRWYEGFPMSLIEAMSLGTPCIVPRLGNAGDIIEEGRSGYHYDPDDTDSCMHALKKPLNINDAVRHEYETKYSRAKNYEILLGIYRKLIEENAHE